MKRAARATLVVLLLLALLAATGLVMSRNRRMSLFLEAKDRLARGEEPALVLHRLSDQVDWDAEEGPEASRIAGEVLGKRAPGGVLVHRAGPYALLRFGGERIIAERRRGVWGRVE
ncbi:MAG: hypothetical protein ACYTDY_17825 [Planctomycetota bacterium]|jgi:hypothetical protein